MSPSAPESQDGPSPAPAVPPSVAPWGELDGRPVSLYGLRTRGGLRARISDYGGTIVALEVPDASGRHADVALGFDRIEGERGAAYRSSSLYLGALIGRVANRIAAARFSLDGVPHALSANEGEHHLHGGADGFDRRPWAAQPFASRDGSGLALTLVSPDGDQGYPGTLVASALYRLLEPATLRLELRASCDRPTPVSLTQHSYFNLAGHDAGSILEHELTVPADVTTPADAALIPTGEVRSVEGTAVDFRTPTPIGQRIDAPELRRPGGDGYDANLVLRGPAGTLRRAARLRDPSSGRVMEVWTTQPALQLYSGNALAGLQGKGGARYGRYAGVALEPQGFPNAVNVPYFPPVWLRPGEGYYQVIEYRFSAAGRGV